MYRSLMFVPASNDKFLKNSINFNADVIVYDLEDSVPFNLKDTSLSNLLSLDLALKVRPIVRVNKFNEGYSAREVVPLLNNFDILLPKADSIYELDMLFSNIGQNSDLTKRFWLLVESASSFISIVEIVRAYRSNIKGLVFGAEDYLASIDGLHFDNDPHLMALRMHIINVAYANSLIAIDSPCLSVVDDKLMCSYFRSSRSMGFHGALVIHPRQIELANSSYSVDDESIIEAKTVIEGYNAHIANGRGIYQKDGVIVGPPMIKKYHNILKRSSLSDGLFDVEV
jgi:citrate lyase beta subunit